MGFKEEIMAYLPTSESQQKNKDVLLKYYDIFKNNLFLRENDLAHVTASSIILNKKMDKMLMIYHNIYKSYGWQGGHNDGDEDCLRVALKEAYEETSLSKIDEISDKIYSIDILPVYGHIKKGKYVNTHLHLNVTYVFIADENLPIHIKEDENSDIKWIKINELDNYVNEADVLEIYKRVIKEYKED